MTTAPQILHTLAGSPAQPSCSERERAEQCYLCAGSSLRVAPVDRALGGSFTSGAWASAQWSSWICEACVWACGGKPGQDPPPLRMRSHLYREGAWLAFAKDRVQEAWSTLLDPPSGEWFLALAESGQVQVVPWAPINRGGLTWAVRYERETVVCVVRDFAALAYHALELYAAGFPRAVVLDGKPDVMTLSRCGVTAWREHDPHIAPHRGGPALRVVCALIRKEGMDGPRELAARVAGIDRRAVSARSGDADPGDPPLDRLAAGEPAHVLGADAGGGASPRADGDDVRAARRKRAPRARDRAVPQRGVEGDLFAGG